MQTTREYIDYCLRNEAKIKIAIWEKRLDRGAKRGSGGRGTGIGRPTEMKAIMNLMPVGAVLVDNFITIDHPETVVKNIACVKAYFNSLPQGKVYQLHYIDGIDDYKIICDRLDYKSPQTYYNHLNAILDYAEKVWNVSQPWG